jgi:hypothetical protein
MTMSEATLSRVEGCILTLDKSRLKDFLYAQNFYGHAKKFVLFITMQCEYPRSLVVFVIRDSPVVVALIRVCRCRAGPGEDNKKEVPA